MLTAANVPKIANTDFRHITDMLHKFIKFENNVNILMMTIKLMGALAKGLRKNFSPYAKMFF